MTELRIGDQLIRFDLDATLLAYSQLEQGDADRCTCTGCRNFALLREKVYPDTFRNLLGQLGIDPRKEGEAVHYGPRGDLQSYGGSFYFVGEVIDEGEHLLEIRNLEGTGLTKITQERRVSNATFQYWFSKSFPKPPELFGKPVAAVEFMTELPWVLDVAYDAFADTKMAKAEGVMDRYEDTLRDLAKPSNQN
jgi:hypothetical protein